MHHLGAADLGLQLLPRGGGQADVGELQASAWHAVRALESDALLARGGAADIGEFDVRDGNCVGVGAAVSRNASIAIELQLKHTYDAYTFEDAPYSESEVMCACHCHQVGLWCCIY